MALGTEAVPTEPSRREPRLDEVLDALRGRAGHEARLAAVADAQSLVQAWRGHYREYGELAVLLGDLLGDEDPVMRLRAAYALAAMDELAGPAADALARFLDASPRRLAPTEMRPLVPWGDSMGISPALEALAKLGDERALPALGWILASEMPHGLGRVIAWMGPAAAELAPRIRSRLDRMPPNDVYFKLHRSWLVSALGALGDAAAPAVPDLVAMLERDDSTGNVLLALARLGPVAAGAAPALRRFLDAAGPAPDPTHRTVWAAAALRRIDPELDPASTLPVLLRHLDADGPANLGLVNAAAKELAELGPAAAPAAGRLEALLAAPTPLTRLHAAGALWRVTGDVDATLPVLLDVWAKAGFAAIQVAWVAGTIGPAAEAAIPPLHQELSRARRHQSYPGVHSDEALLSACALALASITGSPPEPGTEAEPRPSLNPRLSSVYEPPDYLPDHLRARAAD